LHIDYKKRHIETEKKFYMKMNQKRTFLLTIIIVGIGLFYLYMLYWSIKQIEEIGLFLWSLIIGRLFLIETIIGYSIFKYERKKYIVL
jgi:hypothetical protein